MIYASRYLRLTTPPMEGPDVYALQEQLLRRGFLQRRPTGIFDTKTKGAVITLQQVYSLLCDGIVDPTVWNKLEPVGLTYSLAQGGYAIQINRDTRTLSLYNGNTATKTYSVAVGKSATPTPLGSYRIIEKKVNPGGAFGARWMRFYGGFGIHGTNNPSSIGKAVSHGCVRMYNGDAIDLYGKVSIGTPVRIVGASARARELALGIIPGNDIFQLQGLLREFGYYAGPIQGFYDQATMQAVADFQYACGIIADGIVGLETQGALRKYYAITHHDIEP